MNSTIETLLGHRSIRRFADTPIDPELLRRIVRAGQAASTSSFCQSVSVIRIRDAELRNQLASLSGGQPYIVSAAEFLVFCADLARVRDRSIERNLASQSALEFDWVEC